MHKRSVYSQLDTFYAVKIVYTGIHKCNNEGIGYLQGLMKCREIQVLRHFTFLILIYNVLISTKNLNILSLSYIIQCKKITPQKEVR